jgi:hypothetical protein
MGVLVFVHEGVLLETVPFAVLLVAVLTPANDRRLLGIALLVAPAVVAGVAVAIFGTASATEVAALRADARGFSLGTVTAFDYVDDSLRTSLELVRAMPLRIKTASLGLGLGLAAVHGWWIVRWVREHPVRVVRERATRLGDVALISAAAATLALFGIGVDWVRWFASIGCTLLIVVSFVLLSRPSGKQLERVTLPRLLPLVAIYLTALAPLPEFAFPKDVVRLLVLKQ